jgi:hypothetical protein
MPRRVVGLTVCCLLLAWGLVAAPRKDDPSPVYYLQSTVGDKSVYVSNDGDQSWDYVLEVTAARHEGAILLVTLQGGAAGKEPQSYRYEVSEKGVCKVAQGETVLEVPECFLRLPFKKGVTWEITQTQDGETYTTQYAVGGEEEVEVPAGKFRCVSIESVCAFKGITWTYTEWVAPRYGMVKELLVGKDNDSVRTDYVRTSALKFFTPGGK